MGLVCYNSLGSTGWQISPHSLLPGPAPHSGELHSRGQNVGVCLHCVSLEGAPWPWLTAQAVFAAMTGWAGLSEPPQL